MSRTSTQTIVFCFQSNMASLCSTTPANDAVASSIANAAVRFAWLDTLSSKGVFTGRDAVRKYTAGCEPERMLAETFPQNKSCTNRKSVRSSSWKHRVVEMEPTICLVTLEKSLVNTPSGGANTFYGLCQVAGDTAHFQPHLPPKVIVIRRPSLSEVSTTSSITYVDQTPNLTSMDFNCEKMFNVLLVDGCQTGACISDEAVEALASLLLQTTCTSRRSSSVSREQPHTLVGSSAGNHHRGITSFTTCLTDYCNRSCSCYRGDALRRDSKTKRRRPMVR